MEFSVLMPVHSRDNLEHLRLAIDSILNQTYKPKQIVFVVGGEDNAAMNDLLSGYDADEVEIVIVRQTDSGLPNALNLGLNYCKYDYVARMDSDDICVKERFELQVKYFEQNPDVSAIGGFVYEFEGDIKNIIAIRDLPCAFEDLCEYMKMRDPLHHPTVMYRKADVLKVGGYSTTYFPEDTFLWVSMYLEGFKFINIPYNLTYMRTGYDLIQRRSGKKLYLQMKEIYKFMLEKHVINKRIYRKILFIRYTVSVLCPRFLQKIIFFRILRKKPKRKEIEKYLYRETKNEF